MTDASPPDASPSEYEPPRLDVPAQEQPYPGRAQDLRPRPLDEMADYAGSGLLDGKSCLVTGGDSGIGRAVAVAFAKEGAHVTIGHLSASEREDADRTRALVEAAGRTCRVVEGDVVDPGVNERLLTAALEETGSLDVLVPNAAYQHFTGGIDEIGDEQLERTFAVNVFAPFRLVRSALPHMQAGSAIIVTASVTGLRGNPALIDYASSKGALIAFTFSLASALSDKGIRVNAVAPGPVWTPLIPATGDAEKVKGFGTDTSMGRPAHPDEIAPSYVFLAAPRLSSYYSGEVLAPIGGQPLPA